MADYDKFCKLFESERYAQILVTRGYESDDEDAVESIVLTVAPRGLDFCSMTLGFAEAETADKAFAELTLEAAEALVQAIDVSIEKAVNGEGLED